MNKKANMQLLIMLAMAALAIGAIVWGTMWYMDSRGYEVTYTLVNGWVEPEHAIDGERETYTTFKRSGPAHREFQATFQGVDAEKNVTFIFGRYGKVNAWEFVIPDTCYQDSDVTIVHVMDLLYSPYRKEYFIKHGGYCEMDDGRHKFFQRNGYEPNADKLYELEVG